MICHNSVGYDAQIKDLLIKSAFNMDKKEIDAWMKYQYDPQHMFCFWQDDKITSCLQVTKRTMMFLDRQMRVSVIGMAATLPDYRQRKQFSNLLDAAISQAKAAGLENLKGHRTVGGMRASIYNAMPDRKSTRLNSSHANESRMPSSA